MKKFTLSKGDHIVTTVSAIEAVNYRARGYRDVQPEPVKAPVIKTKAKAPEAKAEPTEQ